MATKSIKPRPITALDLWQFERLGAPSLSPDGAQAVASLTRYSMDENKGSSQLWLLSTRHSCCRRVTPAVDACRAVDRRIFYAHSDIIIIRK